jgi:hypothetical protein
MQLPVLEALIAHTAIAENGGPQGRRFCLHRHHYFPA